MLLSSKGVGEENPPAGAIESGAWYWTVDNKRYSSLSSRLLSSFASTNCHVVASYSCVDNSWSFDWRYWFADILSHWYNIGQTYIHKKCKYLSN